MQAENMYNWNNSHFPPEYRDTGPKPSCTHSSDGSLYLSSDGHYSSV